MAGRRRPVVVVVRDSEDSVDSEGKDRPLSTIVSVGPPLVVAITGSPEAIASSGTMPKCSYMGV